MSLITLSSLLLDENGSNMLQTLASLDWCLEQLEHLQTHRSVADMAADKFKMMLNRELSVLSKSSREGEHTSNYITSNFYGIRITTMFDIDNSKLYMEDLQFKSCRVSTTARVQ